MTATRTTVGFLRELTRAAALLGVSDCPGAFAHPRDDRESVFQLTPPPPHSRCLFHVDEYVYFSKEKKTNPKGTEGVAQELLEENKKQ